MKRSLIAAATLLFLTQNAHAVDSYGVVASTKTLSFDRVSFTVRWNESTYGPVAVPSIGGTFEQDQWHTRTNETSFKTRNAAVDFAGLAEFNGMMGVRVFRVTEEEIDWKDEFKP